MVYNCAMPTARIMLAQHPLALAVSEQALADYDLIKVADMTAAKTHITDAGIDLFLLGIHFDESRAIELLNLIRREDCHKDTPVLLVRTLATPMAEHIRASINGLLRVKTVSQYLELESMRDPQQALRDAVATILAQK